MSAMGAAGDMNGQNCRVVNVRKKKIEGQDKQSNGNEAQDESKGEEKERRKGRRKERGERGGEGERRTGTHKKM